MGRVKWVFVHFTFDEYFKFKFIVLFSMDLPGTSLRGQLKSS